MMFKREEGFTLVELMVVVLIIGILVAIAIPVFLNASANAQLKSCQASQRTIEGAVQTYNSTDTGVTTPYATGGALVNSSNVLIETTIKSVPKCPSGADTDFYATYGGVVVDDQATAAPTDDTYAGVHEHF